MMRRRKMVQANGRTAMPSLRLDFYEVKYRDENSEG